MRVGGGVRSRVATKCDRVVTWFFVGDRSVSLSKPSSAFCGSCSLREAESGCAPDRAVTFFCFAKRKSPKKRRPDGGGSAVGRTSLRCSVFGASRRTRCVRFAHCAQTNVAKSVDEARLRARPQTPALLDASNGAQEQYVARCASIPSTPRCRCEARRVAKKSQYVCGLSKAWRGQAEPLQPKRDDQISWCSASLLWLLSFDATNVRAAGGCSLCEAKLRSHQSDSPAGATTRRTRR